MTEAAVYHSGRMHCPSEEFQISPSQLYIRTHKRM